VGPVCPVQAAGRPCLDHPVKAVITVTRSGSNRVVQSTTTGSDGRFAFILDPGSYVLTTRLQAQLPKSRPHQRKVTVQRDHFSTLILRFDSGIR
jgi:hypothetical protein